LLPHCCGAFHQAWADGRVDAQAPDALALMRSRYSAYVLDLTDYLRATWHPSTRPATLERNEPGLQWLGLTIQTHRRLDAAHEEVGFVARSKLAGRAHRLQETSRFLCEEGRWYYVDGDLR
jgi:SEC-C motif domain protein